MYQVVTASEAKLRNLILALLPGIICECICFPQGPIGVASPVYCAYEVKVSTPLGRPISNLPVAMMTRSKELFFETRTDETGVARICDAPLEFIDLIVGMDICGAVHVNRLKFR